jgi:hypothetical protein
LQEFENVLIYNNHIVCTLKKPSKYIKSSLIPATSGTRCSTARLVKGNFIKETNKVSKNINETSIS